MSDDEESRVVRDLRSRVASLECALAQRVGLRREIEGLLGVGDTTGEEQFRAAIERVRALGKAEARVAELEAAIRGACSCREDRAPPCADFHADAHVSDYCCGCGHHEVCHVGRRHG